MKIEVRSVNDATKFIRERMLESMNRSVASMRQCGSSKEAIQAMIDDTIDKIEEACDEAAEIFAAAEEEFNAPGTLH